MTDQPRNAPLDVLRDGALKATVWRNEGEKGVYFTTTLSKTFEQNGELRDGQNFSGTDLLRVAELARHAYETIRNHRLTESWAKRQSTNGASTAPSPAA